jgi:hypothetical protein
MKLQLLELEKTPVLSPQHPDAAGVRFGFEGGTAHKVGGRYYIFTTEVFDEPKTSASRLSCWMSEDGRWFERQSVIAETNRDWNDETYRMAPWSPMVVFDPETDRWHLFHVGYKRKPGSEQPYNMTGRILHLQSSAPGVDGIGGPFEEIGWVELSGEPDPWEGPAAIVSFFPFLTDSGWTAFYGSNSAPEFIDPLSLPQHDTEAPSIRFFVGLASAAGIQGPWTRMSARNPVLMDPDFIENPIVTRLRDDLYVVVYDGGNTDAISYAFSEDGLTWQPEQLVMLPSPPEWLNAVRTPLGVMDEGDGTFTIYFTAFDGVNPEHVEPLWHDGFGYLGRCKVTLDSGHAG